MPIDIAYSFNRVSAKPLETNRQFVDISSRDAMPLYLRWEGMLAYVISDTETYVLKGGIANTDWTPFVGGGGGGTSTRFGFATEDDDASENRSFGLNNYSFSIGDGFLNGAYLSLDNSTAGEAYTEIMATSSGAESYTYYDSFDGGAYQNMNTRNGGSSQQSSINVSSWDNSGVNTQDITLRTDSSDVGTSYNYFEMQATNDGSGDVNRYVRISSRNASDNLSQTFVDVANLTGDYTIPLSVNGIFADNAGNITIPGGGGGTTYTAENAVNISSDVIKLGGAFTETETILGETALGYDNQNQFILYSTLQGTDGSKEGYENFAKMSLEDDDNFGFYLQGYNIIDDFRTPGEFGTVRGQFGNVLTADFPSGEEIRVESEGRVSYNNTTDALNTSIYHKTGITRNDHNAYNDIYISNNDGAVYAYLGTIYDDGSDYSYADIEVQSVDENPLISFFLENTDNGLYIETPTDISGYDYDTRTLPISVNGVFADATGNITIAGGGSGEANTTSTTGAGESLTLTKVGSDLPFKSITAGTNVTFDVTANDITINASGGGGGSTPSWQDTIDVDSSVSATDNTVQLNLDRYAGQIDFWMRDLSNTDNVITYGVIDGFSPYFQVEGTDPGGYFGVDISGSVDINGRDGSVRLLAESIYASEPQKRRSSLFLDIDDMFLATFNPNDGSGAGLEFNGTNERVMLYKKLSSGVENRFELQTPTGGGLSSVILPALNLPAFNDKYVPLYFTDGSTTVEADSTGLVDISSISGGSSYTDEEAQDAIGAAIAAGTSTRISIGYNDASNLFNFTVDDDLSNYDNSTSLFLIEGTVVSAIDSALGQTNWKSGGASQLSDLSDVNTSTATNKNVLVADGADWESRALLVDDISDLTATATELNYVDGVTSDIQDQIDSKLSVTIASAHINATDNPHSVTKSQVGLGNVDNTSDADKPISTATQTALDTKGNVSNTGTPVDNQLAIWTSATEIEGLPELIWASDGLRIEGTGGSSFPLTISADPSSNSNDVYFTVSSGSTGLAIVDIGSSAIVHDSDTNEFFINVEGTERIRIEDGGDFILLDGTLSARLNLDLLTSSYTYQLPDKGGTFALLSDVFTYTTEANESVSGTDTLNHDNYYFGIKTMTADTTFSDSNLVVDGITRGMYLTGDFAPSFPAYWEADPNSETYDGTVTCRLTWDVLNATGASEDVRYSITVLSS